MSFDTSPAFSDHVDFVGSFDSIVLQVLNFELLVRDQC